MNKSEEALETIVVVGGGQAGGEVAMQLRQQGFMGHLLVLGDEPQQPYLRPPLSKTFLTGEVNKESLLARAPEAYERSRVEIRTDTRVARIERHERRVHTASGQVIGYSKLVLSTGGRPRRMKVPGADLRKIFYLRTIADVEALQAEFLPGRRLVIVGGGYIGLEVASVAIKRNLDVTVLEGADRVLARVTSPEMSAFYENVHRAEGVRICTGVAVSGFIAKDAGDAVGSVECGKDAAVSADLVIVGIGLIPNTELAEAAGLLIDNGIVVDEHQRTSDPTIYAIGDCSTYASHGFLRRKVRLESVPNAVEQARIAAASICGKPNPTVAPPWFWSDQYGLKLQMVGLSEGYDNLVIRGNPESQSFITFYFRDRQLIAADAVNRVGEFMLAKKLVGERKIVSPELLADETTPLKQMVT